VLPRPFAPVAVIFGAIAPVLGLAGLFTVTANNNGPVGAAINSLVALQGLWIIAASLTLPLRRPRADLRAGRAVGRPPRGSSAWMLPSGHAATGASVLRMAFADTVV
jgi:hypothetical protein